MKVEQISVFLENKAGRLAEVTAALALGGINIRALSLADTSDFGILRLIVNDHEKAKSILKDRGFTVGRTSVVGVEVPDHPGGLNSILQTLSQNGVNVEYMYGFVEPQAKKAMMVFRFDEPAQAVQVLRSEHINVVARKDIA